jgi:hypothetical protein
MPSVIGSLLQRRNVKADLRAEFENLKDGSFDVTSKWTGVYNCIAHAAQDSKRKWWPVPLQFARNDVFWPEPTRRRTLRAFRLAFETLGFEPCDNGELEAGYEKVAIYVSDTPTPDNPLDAPTHMARQLPCGRWTSKLGDKEDIAHDDVQGLEGRIYGRVTQFLKRRIIPIVPLQENGESANGEQAESQ